MVAGTTPDVKNIAKSVGLLIDRTQEDGILGNVWVIDQDKVATCAHLAVSYEQYLSALLVKFPHSNQVYGVEKSMFHPKFDKALVSQMVQVALTEPMPTLPLQRHNAVVLTLTEKLPQLTDTINWRVNKHMSLPVPPRDQGLGGNLGEIDLYVVLQTINAARKEGVLTICDDRNHPVARVFCKDGRLLYAQYRNLNNEMAIYQIVSRQVKGNFYFWSAESPNWEVSSPIARPADMLLIEAHRRFDELKNLVPLVGPPDSLFVTSRKEPNFEVLPGELQDYCRYLWELLDGGTPLNQLWQVANLDDHSIYATLAELKRTQQIAPVSKSQQVLGGDRQEQLTPLEPAYEVVLEPWDELFNVNVEPDGGRPMLRKGCLLGNLREDDQWHLLHNVRLLPEASGSPMLKDGKVIGMHCGRLPPNFNEQNRDGSLQAMLWVESIIECLRSGGEKKLVNRLTLVNAEINTGNLLNPVQGSQEAQQESQGAAPQSTPAPAPATAVATPKRKLPGGCKEVARFDCPKCGRTSLQSARFCKSCGQQLLRELESPASGSSSQRSRTPVYVALCCLLLLGMVAGSLFFMSLPKPILVAPSKLMVAERPWVDLDVWQKVLHDTASGVVTEDWLKQPGGKVFLEGDFIHLHISIHKDSHVYLIYKGCTEQAPTALIYPVSSVEDTVLKEGDSFTFPSEISEGEKHNKKLIGLSISDSPGVETFVVVASRSRLALTEDSALVQRVFDKASTLIDKERTRTGLEVPVAELARDILPKSSESTGSKGKNEDSIYIRKWLVKHKKPDVLEGAKEQNDANQK